MSSALISAADDLVSMLNGHAFSTSFTATRTYLVEKQLKELLGYLFVSVVPRGEKIEPISRESFIRSLSIDIAVQKKPNAFTNAELDPLVLLVEEIVNFLDGVSISGNEQSKITVVNPNPIFAEEHLEEFRVFTSVISLTVKVLP